MTPLRPLRRLARLTREPFVRFLALGGLIFAVHAALVPHDDRGSRRIEVSAADVERLRAVALRQWGREPDAAQTRALVSAFVREEVLYREALARGIDRDDTVVRRRLAQKMEFLAQEDVGSPGEAQVRAEYEAHADRYLAPEGLDLEQVCFSRDLRGDHADADARHALAALRSGRAAPGDRCALGRALTGRTQAMLARDLGDAVANAVFAVPDGHWSGPIASPFGLHLIRVVARHGGAATRYDAVRERVRTDLLSRRVAEARDQAYQRVLARYHVTVATEVAPPTRVTVASVAR